MRQKVLDTLFAAPVVNGTAGLRVDIDTSNERMQKKIRDAQLQKIPYMLVVGEREAAEGTVAVRLRSAQGSGGHAAGNFRRPHQKRGGIPCGCGRIALSGRAFPPILAAIRPYGRSAARRIHRRSPACVHDRTSFRLGSDGTSEAWMRAAVQRRVIVPRRFQGSAPAPAKDGPRINDEITSKTILLIGDDGHKYGEIGLEEALALGEEKGFDVVEVSPDNKPPVCKLMDYGKYKYEQQKKAAEARKKQKVIEIKEIKMRPTIDDHDYDVKMRAMKRFFDEGDKVKVTPALPRPRNGAPASGHGPSDPRPERHRSIRQAGTVSEDGRPSDDDGSGAHGSGPSSLANLLPPNCRSRQRPTGATRRHWRRYNLWAKPANAI